MYSKRLFSIFLGLTFVLGTVTPSGKAFAYHSSAQADLKIARVTVVPANPTVDDLITLAVTVKNQGTKSAKKFRVQAKDQKSSWSKSLSIKKLYAGKTKTYYLTLPAQDDQELLANNPHEFNVVVDPYNKVYESNEANNTYYYSFSVSDSQDYEQSYEDDVITSYPTVPPTETVQQESMPVLRLAESSEVPAAIAPKGAKRVPIINLRFTMDSTSDVYLDMIKLTRKGVGSLTDFDAVTVFQENGGAHLGFARLDYVNNKVIFDFRENYGSVKIKAGESFSIQIKGDLETTAVTANENIFYVDEVYAHLPNKAPNQDLGIYFSNGIPTGNSITVAANQAGKATITKVNTSLTPVASGIQQKIASFSIKAVDENQILKSVILQLDGSAAQSVSTVVNNPKLVDATTGAVYAQQVGAGNDSKKRIVFILSNELSLSMNEQKEFVVMADVASSIPVGSVLKVYLPYENYLYSLSTTYNYGVQVDATAYDNSAQNGSDASWSTVSTSTEQPTATLTVTRAPFPETYTYLEIPQGRPNTRFATFNLQTGGQPVVIKNLTLKGYTKTTGVSVAQYISGVRLEMDRFGTIAQQSSGFNGTASFTNLQLTLPANSQTKLKVYGDAALGASQFPMGVRLSFETADSIGAYDQAGNLISLSSVQFPLTSNWLDIVKSGAFIVRNMTQEANTTVQPGAQAITMLKFGLETTLEDFKVNEMKITISGPTNMSKLALYDDKGTFYADQGVVSDNSGQWVKFNPQTLTIPAGGSKSMVVKGYFSEKSQANSANSLTLKTMSASGKSSTVTQSSEPNYQGSTTTIASTPTYPDLVVTNIYFDSQAVLNYTFKNSGNGTIPDNQGYVSVTSKDTEAFRNNSFSQIADQSFRQPGGSSSFKTGLRMQGSNRVIAVHLDPTNQIKESNESNNMMTVTLTPPAQVGADYIISSLNLDSQGILQVSVKNQGTAASSKQASGYLRTSVNGSFVNDFVVTVPILAINQTHVLIPSQTLKPASNSKVKVEFLINYSSANDVTVYEIDTTNNTRQETPSPVVVSDPTLTTRSELARYVVTINRMTIDTTGGPHYQDVPTTHPDYTYVETVHNKGVMTGLQDGLFHPEDITTRANVSKIAVAAFQMPIETSGGPHYKDVQPSHPYYSYIETVFHYLGFSNNGNTETFEPDKSASDSFSRDYTLDILERILKNLWVVYDTPVDQWVKPGQQNVNFLTLYTQVIWHPATLEKIQVTAVDANGAQYANITQILDALYLMEGNTVVATASFNNNGYLEFTNMNLSLKEFETRQLKFVGNIKTDAPVGSKVQLQIRKTSVFSPSGVITKDDRGIYNLIQYPTSAVAFKTFEYKGNMTTVVSN